MTTIAVYASEAIREVGDVIDMELPEVLRRFVRGVVGDGDGA